MQPITDKRGASLSIGALSQQTGVHTGRLELT